MEHRTRIHHHNFHDRVVPLNKLEGKAEFNDDQFLVFEEKYLTTFSQFQPVGGDRGNGEDLVPRLESIRGLAIRCVDVFTVISTVPVGRYWYLATT